jgi:hypothetical protein
VKAALTAILLLAGGLSAPAHAQIPNRSQPAILSTAYRSAADRALDPDDARGKAIGDALRRKAEERERAWDRKMRRTMGAICTGC